MTKLGKNAFGLGKASTAALRAARAEKLRAPKAALSLRAKRAVMRQSANGQIIENELSAWTEFRALEAIIDAEVDLAKINPALDDAMRAGTDDVTESAAKRPQRGQSRDAPETGTRQCEIDSCQASTLSGNRQLKGRCGPLEASGSRTGDFSFDFSVGPGSVTVTPGTSQVSASTSVSLTDCASLEFSTSDAQSGQVQGAGCAVCGVGFNRLVELFDAPAVENLETSSAPESVDRQSIEKLIGLPEDWQALRNDISKKSPTATVEADLRGDQYLIEITGLPRGLKVSVLPMVWHRLGAVQDRALLEKVTCEANYCPPGASEKKLNSSISRSSSWLRGSCTVLPDKTASKLHEKFWFQVSRSKVSVNLFDSKFPNQNPFTSAYPVQLQNRICRSKTSGDSGSLLVEIEATSLADLVTRFSSKSSF